MFSRIELKNNAKRILSKNYWWIVLVTLILGMVSGSGAGINLNLNLSGNSSTEYSSYDDIFNDEYMDISDAYSNGRIRFGTEYENIINEVEKMISGISMVEIGIILIVFLIVFVIALALSIFVMNPLHVGCKRWFLMNRKEKPEIGEIAHVFSNGYGNTVKVMFLKDLYVFFWSLLFVIPGIVKGYEYRMVPYLLAENPNMDRHEAFKRSKSLMNGNKWDAFVLDMSFIGWILIAGLTCGILSLLYVSPYMALTDTELYVCLCQGKEKYTAENNGSTNQSNGFTDEFNNLY